MSENEFSVHEFIVREMGYPGVIKQEVVGELVRCADCKWWREETDHTCRKWGGASPRNANGYCDDGERREDEF